MLVLDGLDGLDGLKNGTKTPPFSIRRDEHPSNIQVTSMTSQSFEPHFFGETVAKSMGT
jgi:hypothetical protein